MNTTLLKIHGILTALVLLFIFQAPSRAAISVTTGGAAAPSLDYGLVSAEGGIFTIDFNEIDLSTQGTSYVSDDATFTGLTAFSDGSIVKGDSSSQYKAPDNDTTNYLSVGGKRSGTVTINFANGISYFGLYWGTPDTYNGIEFFDADDKSLGSYSPPVDLTASNYYNFTIVPNTGAIAKIVLSSNTAAMEVDNFSYVAVPEPSTCILFGFAALGVLIFRRRSVAV